MATAGSRSRGLAFFFHLGSSLHLTKAVLLLLLLQKSIDGIQEVGLLNKFLTFRVPVMDMLGNDGVSFEVASFNGVKSFSGKIKLLEGEVGNNKGGKGDGKEQEFNNRVYGFNDVVTGKAPHTRVKRESIGKG